jgi:hypothetical protein
LCLSCEDYWDPSWHREFGVRESRTSSQANSQKRHELLLLRYPTGSTEKVLFGINIMPRGGSLYFWSGVRGWLIKVHIFSDSSCVRSSLMHHHFRIDCADARSYLFIIPDYCTPSRKTGIVPLLKQKAILHCSESLLRTHTHLRSTNPPPLLYSFSSPLLSLYLSSTFPKIFLFFRKIEDLPPPSSSPLLLFLHNIQYFSSYKPNTFVST